MTMENFRYFKGVSTLKLDTEKCIGCGICQMVCPHGVFKIHEKKACIIDHDGCMECGACALNCLGYALSVTPGVGCAEYIISGWIKGKENASCGSGVGCC